MEFWNRVKSSILKNEIKQEWVAKQAGMDFSAFRSTVSRPALPAPVVPDVDFAVRGSTVFLDGSECLTFSDALPEQERSFLERLLHDAYQARQGNRLAHVVSVYDRGEAMAVDRFLKAHRAK